MYIDFTVFYTLFDEAGNYKNEDMYIAERGWQEWMNPFEAEEVADILRSIYAIRRMNLSQIRDMLRIPSRPAMSREFRIPLRSLENWESGQREAPEYVTALLYYVVFLKRMNMEGKMDSGEN